MTVPAEHRVARSLPRTPPPRAGTAAPHSVPGPASRPSRWPATCQSRDAVWDRLTRAPFVLDNADAQKTRRRGLTLLLDWLDDQPGQTWQERWLASGADAAGADWRADPRPVAAERGLVAGWRLPMRWPRRCWSRSAPISSGPRWAGWWPVPPARAPGPQPGPHP